MRTPAHARTSFLVTPRLRALAQAPEVADAPDTYKGDLVDVWSLGVMLYVCVVCDYPFGAPALSFCKPLSQNLRLTRARRGLL